MTKSPITPTPFMIIASLGIIPTDQMTDALCDRISDMIIAIADDMPRDDFLEIMRIAESIHPDHAPHILDTFRDNTQFSSIDLP